MSEDWQNSESWVRALVQQGAALTAEQGNGLLAALDEARRDAHERQGALDVAHGEVEKLRRLAERAAALVVFAEGVSAALRDVGIEPPPDACPACDKPQSEHCAGCSWCPGSGHDDMCGWPVDDKDD